MIATRGLTMSKVTHLRQALHQILADEAVPTTTTALILGEHDLCRADVMVACDVLEDVVTEFRRRENAAMEPGTSGVVLDALAYPMEVGHATQDAGTEQP
jgi:hypothetical protein